MADQKLPAFTGDTALDLILLVTKAETLRDLGIHVWRMAGHCSTHGDRVAVTYTDGPEPTQAEMQCSPCSVNGTIRRIRVEHLERVP